MVGICGSQSLLSLTGFGITGFRLGRHSSVIYRKAYLKEERLTPPSMWVAATCEVPDLIKGKRRQPTKCQPFPSLCFFTHLDLLTMGN